MLAVQACLKSRIHELRIMRRIIYDADTKAMPIATKRDSGAGVCSCSISMPKSVAANVKGMKKNASSVSLAVPSASAMERRLSSKAMFE